MSGSTVRIRQRQPDRFAPRADEPPAEGPLTADDIFHLLQARRRRLVLHYLRGREEPVAMRDVAEQVAAWEYDTTPQALRSQERQRVYIALYQDHLPTLDDAGVIDYDQSRGIIEPTDYAHALYPYLSPRNEETVAMEDERTVPDSTAYYSGASLVSVGLFTAFWTGFIALPATVVAAITTVLFTLVTLGSRWRSVRRVESNALSGPRAAVLCLSNAIVGDRRRRVR